MVIMARRRFPWLWFVALVAFVYLSGLYQYAFTWPYSQYYTDWGPTHPLQLIIRQYKAGENMHVRPVNDFSYPYKYTSQDKCNSRESIRLMYVVKSAIGNFDKRMGIRKSWGFEKRFSDVEIRTVFLLGQSNGDAHMEKLVEKENEEEKDIIQASFIDSYMNNTIKTMMGLHWTYHYCNNVKYFLFVDDDYYVSTRNMLRFLRNPEYYPQYLEKHIVQAMNEYKKDLYAGYMFKGSRPIRWVFSRWYISLDVYPYSEWPPYITAGAYVLSRKSLEELYLASIYTYSFPFDDVFLGMVAKKAGIKQLHHKEFYYYKKLYSPEDYKWVIASHGFDDPEELQRVWSEQRAAGNA